MSRFQNVELYDPESPSVDDDLCLELDQPNAREFTQPAASCLSEIEDVANADQAFSATKDSADLVKSQYTTDIVQTQHFKQLTVIKPTVTWKSTKKVLGPTLKEFDDVQAVKEDTVKASLNATCPDTSLNSPNCDHFQNSQSTEQLQQVNAAASDDLGTVNTCVSQSITTEKDNACDRIGEGDSLPRICVSEPNSTQYSSHTDSIDEIAEPTEPFVADDETTALTQQPRTIKLSRIIENPSEPDELLETSDADCSSECVKCPRIIRLDRDSDVEECPVADQCDSYLSDPSEPTDTEPLDDESHGLVPREIKLDRVDHSKILFDSFVFPEKQEDDSSLIKPRVTQLNTLLSKTFVPLSGTDLFGNSSEINTTNEIDSFYDAPLSPSESAKSVSNEAASCRDTPLSPLESLESPSDSEFEEKESAKPQMPEVNVLENYNNRYSGMDVENKCQQSHSTSNGLKSDHSISSPQHLSDGEIVDDEETEECGIFQIPVCGLVHLSMKEKENSEEREKNSSRKRLHKDVVDDLSHNKSEDEPGSSKRTKRPKLSKSACSAKSKETSYAVNGDKSTSISTQAKHSISVKSKATSEFPSFTKQMHKKRKTAQASKSFERLLVRDSNTARRKVIVVNKRVDESDNDRSREHRVLHSDVVTRKTTPVFSKEKRTLDRRKRAARRHRKRHLHQNESRARKRKGKHKKHRGRKCFPDAEQIVNDVAQNKSRSRSRSYDRIVEVIRSEEQQSPRARHLRSVVVHNNTLISARVRSSSDSSYDTHHSCDDLTLADVCQNPDSRSRNLSGGHVHLSRLSYTGELEQDGCTTLLGECIKSKFGPDYDANFISRNLTSLLFSTDNTNDDVEILGVSYPGQTQSKNNSNVQHANVGTGSELRDNGTVSEHGEVVHVAPTETLSSDAGGMSVSVRNSSNKDVSADKTVSKKVMVSSKEVQTQLSLFAETLDSVKESSVLSDTSPGRPLCTSDKADKELQVSDFDNNEECIHSPSSTVAVPRGIQSPESHVEEDSHVPRPVLLERTDTSKPTPDSPQQDFSDIYVTVPNASKSLSLLAKTIALERVAESDDLSADVTKPVANASVNSATDHPQCVVASSRTEVNSRSGTGLNMTRSDANASHQLSVSSDIEQLPVTNSDEHYRSSNHSIPSATPAVHHLPPVLLHKPVQYHRAVPLHPPIRDSAGTLRQPSLIEKTSSAVNSYSSPVRLSDRSAVHQLQSEPPVATKQYAQLQQPVHSQSLLTAAKSQLASSMLSSVPPQVHHEYRTKRCSPESLPFFSLKSDRIPGICEDGESEANHYRARIGTALLPSQNSLPYSSVLQSTGSFDVNNVVITSSTNTLSEIRQALVPNYAVSSYTGTASYISDTALPLLSSLTSSALVSSAPLPQSNLMPAIIDSSCNSAVKQSIASSFLPLLGTIATQLFRIPLDQQTRTVPASSTTVSSVMTDGSMPSLSSTSSALTMPVLKSATTSVTSTEAISAWITSLPRTSSVEKPQLLSQPAVELDFDVDAVESPRSDEIMSFSPPSSERMMEIVKMKRTTGLKNKPTKNTTNGFKQPSKTTMTVSYISFNDSRCISL